MRIQHNIMAMNAYRNYMNNTGALSKNLEKLSSGYKINRAGDDAAGLAISEKMRAQITGLDAAQKNVADGISLVQTAEGAMQEIQDMLNRMVYLATQSSNGTYDNEVDRENLQKEVDSLRDEINRIADSANFNGINLLDGSMDGTAKVAELTNMEIGGTGAGALPPVDTTGTAQVGTATITHNDALAGGGSEFSIELHSVAFSNQTGDKIEITIGDDTFTLEAEDDGTELTAAQIATSFKTGTGWKDEADAAMLDADGNITIKGQKFSVEDKGNGVLRFKQVKAPTGEPDYVDPSMAVNVTVTKADGGATQSLRRSTYAEGDNSSGTPGVYSYKIDTAFAAGDTLTINGEAITFGSGSSFDVDTDAAATAADQAAAIKALFANDTTFDVTVDESDNTKIVFTQKTASTADSSVLVEGEFVAAGSGSATGAMGSITNGVTGAAGDKGKYSFTIDTNFADGDQFTLAGKTITMVSSNADASKGEVLIGASEAESAKNIADYFDSEGVTDETMDITYSGSVLTATQKTAAASGATVLSAAPTLSMAPPDKPAFTEVTASGDSTAGEWKFDFSDVAFVAGDSITFGSTTINFTSSGGTSGNSIDLTTTTGAANIADAIASALTTADTTIYTYTGNSDGTISITQKTATDTANVLDANSFTTATTASATGSFTSFTTDQTASNGTQGTWTVSVGTNFATGDTLTVKYGDTTKTLTFGDGNNNTVAVGANEVATAANIATALGSTFGDFNVSESGGTITLTQTVAGTGDGSTVEFTAGKASTGKGTFTEETAAVAPDGSGSGDGTTGTVTGTPASTTDTQISDDPSEDDTYKVAYNNTAIATAAKNHSAASGDITIKNVAGSTAGTVKFQMLVGDTVIGESGDITEADLTDGATFDIKEIANEDNSNANADLSLRGWKVGDTLATITYDTGTNGTKDNMAADILADPLDTGLAYTAPTGGDDDDTATGDVIYDWNASTTNQVNVTAGGTDRLASTYFSLTSAMVKDTNSITIGDKTYTFTADKAKAAANSTTMVDISDLVDEDGNVDADGLAEAAKRLTAVATASNNSVYSVGYDGNRITVTEQNAHADLYATDKQKFDLRTKEGIEESLGWTDNATAAAETGKGLTLQIGDTSDDFNQLTVNIEDMHTDALVHEFVDEDGNKTGEVMSIADIDISTQEGAAKAVDVIRNAINRVSMTRGTLGATQNRLEHTANNLSVMEENITNAESAIRDTDIAEEMMSYTKNNILIQSAQAMLAQANMVPQGVLQLLQ